MMALFTFASIESFSSLGILMLVLGYFDGFSSSWLCLLIGSTSPSDSMSLDSLWGGVRRDSKAVEVWRTVGDQIITELAGLGYFDLIINIIYFLYLAIKP